MPNRFSEEGIVQYFYHSPSSLLPIRDVQNEQGMNPKTEPHIEIGAENFLEECYQRNIKRFASGEGGYIFLITRCANPKMQKYYGNQFIAGYIAREETGEIDKRIFVRGQTLLFSFQDSIPTKEIFGWNFNMPRLVHMPHVNSKKTARILDSFSGKKNILEECIQEIIRLDAENLTCYLPCQFKSECKRFR